MAAVPFLRCLRTCHLSGGNLALPMFVPVRYSRYNKDYIEPTFRFEDLTEPLDEMDERKFRPIKAARNDEVTSLNHDPLVNKFIRQLMDGGEKFAAREVMLKTFEKLKLIQLEKWHDAETEEEREQIELNPKVILHTAVENCTPLLKTKTVRKGAQYYTVPVPMGDNFRTFTAIKWLIEVSNRKGRNVRIWDTLANELLLAHNKEGATVRKKQELHRLCEANRAYAHYRW